MHPRAEEASGAGPSLPSTSSGTPRRQASNPARPSGSFVPAQRWRTATRRRPPRQMNTTHYRHLLYDSELRAACPPARGSARMQTPNRERLPIASAAPAARTDYPDLCATIVIKGDATVDVQSCSVCSLPGSRKVSRRRRDLLSAMASLVNTSRLRRYLERVIILGQVSSVPGGTRGASPVYDIQVYGMPALGVTAKARLSRDLGGRISGVFTVTIVRC